MKNRAKTLAKILSVAFLLYLFLVSIGLMGAAFKGFGKGFAESLIKTTSNPFVGLFIGILATSMVQSSSTVTSVVVGIVAAGGITVTNAVPIVMGANIGTTRHQHPRLTRPRQPQGRVPPRNKRRNRPRLLQPDMRGHPLST